MAELLVPTKLRIVLEVQRAGDDAYGYRLKKRLRLSTATMFEHLAELQKAGLIEARIKAVSGRQRKVYKLTRKAELVLDSLREALSQR